MSKCLCCYKELEPGMVDYHPGCAKRLFGQEQTPAMPYRHTELKDLAKEVIRSQTTVTGVQAKLSMDIQKVQHESRFTLVGLWGKYILKPQTEQYELLPENEDLTMHLAELAGIRTVPHCLVRFEDGALCYLTKRIDRDKKGKKIPMEDFCQLLEHQTEYKYRGSYEQIAKGIRSYSAAPGLDVADFWAEVLFCWLVGNSDMHLKNFSLYNGLDMGMSLTPAYDLVNTLIVMPSDPEELALNLNGRKRKLKKLDFEKAMTTSGMDPKAIENIFKRFRTILPRWEACIDQSFLSNELKQAYKDLLHERLERL